MSKEEIESLKELFNEKIAGLNTHINAQFINVNERLDRIEEQTKKTNGRVTELEKTELLHVIKCPQAAKIEKINEDLNEYRAFLKNPKVYIAGILVLAMLFLAGAGYGINLIFNKKTSVPNTEVSK